MLVNLIRAHDLIINNTFFQKQNQHKIAYRRIGTNVGPPWTPERYEEIDHCITRNSWKNFIIDVQTTPHTNVNTDHYTLMVKVRQKLKAKEQITPELNFKNIDIGPEIDKDGKPNQYIVNFNEKIKEILGNTQHTPDIGDIAKALKQAATETLNMKPSKGKRPDCDPEMATLINNRLHAVIAQDEEQIKEITKAIKKMAAQKRAQKQLAEFQDLNWEPVKRMRKGYIPKHTKIRNRRGEIVNDRIRAETFADYYENEHWAINNNDYQVKRDLLHETHEDINTQPIDLEELNIAIKLLKRKKAPGPDNTTGELYV